MYVDLFVAIALLVFVIIYSRKFQNYIFGFAAVDLLFRILSIINGYIPVIEVSKFINDYVPTSIPSIISKYTSGLVATGLIWSYVILMVIFLYYIIKIFIKRKK